MVSLFYYSILLFSIPSEDMHFFYFFAYTSSLPLPQANRLCSTASVFSIKYLGLPSPRPSLTAPCLSTVSLCLPTESSHSLLPLLIFLLVYVSDPWWWVFSQSSCEPAPFHIYSLKSPLSLALSGPGDPQFRVVLPGIAQLASYFLSAMTTSSSYVPLSFFPCLVNPSSFFRLPVLVSTTSCLLLVACICSVSIP